MNKNCNAKELFNNIKNKLESNVDIVVEESARLLTDKIKRNAPVKTGFLRDNITYKRLENGKYRIVSKAPYSVFVEKKTQFFSKSLTGKTTINLIAKDILK